MALLLILLLMLIIVLHLSFKKKTDRKGNDGTKKIEIMVPLKYLSNFWRTLEMSLIYCEINLILTWSANCFIIDTPVNNEVPTFELFNTKFYGLVNSIL